MRIVLINQTFHPDVMATGQYLTEVAVSLAKRGHAVTVVTGRRGYDEPKTIFPKRENWKGIQIHRVFSTRFGKKAKWRRALDFGSFIASCCWGLLALPRQDVVMALTTPPLISFIGAGVARMWRARFCYWVMDFNPDEAIAAGWLRAGSWLERILSRMSLFSLERADRIIALDRFMRDRIVAKGIAAEKISVIPPWSHDHDVTFEPGGRDRFRKANGLDDKFVVMYSGNHSPCHPLDTVLEAAKRLVNYGEIAFCFVGGGSQFQKVREFAAKHELRNVRCLPYQPLSELAGSLSAADLHLVVMGNAFVGLVHPCKIYNILRIGAPLIYVGPTPSHVSDILDRAGDWPCRRVEHGDSQGMVRAILELKEGTEAHARTKRFPSAERFSMEELVPKLVGVLEELGGKTEIGKLKERTSLKPRMDTNLHEYQKLKS